jgi:hypothetical protein
MSALGRQLPVSRPQPGVRLLSHSGRRPPARLSADVKPHPVPVAVWRARSEPLDGMNVTGHAGYRGRR